MGTRNLTVVIKDKKIRLSQYGQWDGYFSYTGKKFFEFAKHVGIASFSYNVDLLRSISNKVYEDTIFPCYNMLKKNLAKHKLAIPFGILMPQFSRDTGVDILKIIDGLSSDIKPNKFPVYIEKDYSWCEFIYVLDLDEEMAYMLTSWAFKGKPESVPEIISKNYPMACCYKSKLDEIPSIEEIEKVLKTKREDGFQ